MFFVVGEGLNVHESSVGDCHILPTHFAIIGRRGKLDTPERNTGCRSVGIPSLSGVVSVYPVHLYPVQK